MLNTQKKENPGFSLIELVVVVAIFGILTSVAIPSYKQYTANNKAYTYVSDVMIALRIARSTAITEQTPVKVCAINSGAPSFTCNDSASIWNKGWFVSSNSAATVYKAIQFRSDASTIDTGITIAPANSITYSEDGFPTPSSFVITIKPNGCTSGFTITSESGGLLERKLVSC